MIRILNILAIAVLAVSTLAACQTAGGPTARSTPMDGKWASTDGVFVANFRRGSFTSRFTQTNEILAQGTYSVAGTRVSMNWLSVATQQQRSASCTILGRNTVRCDQGGGGTFELKRSA